MKNRILTEPKKLQKNTRQEPNQAFREVSWMRSATGLSGMVGRDGSAAPPRASRAPVLYRSGLMALF
jgi:hypothetical protein